MFCFWCLFIRCLNVKHTELNMISAGLQPLEAYPHMRMLLKIHLNVVWTYTCALGFGRSGSVRVLQLYCFVAVSLNSCAYIYGPIK